MNATPIQFSHLWCPVCGRLIAPGLSPKSGQLTLYATTCSQGHQVTITDIYIPTPGSAAAPDPAPAAAPVEAEAGSWRDREPLF